MDLFVPDQTLLQYRHLKMTLKQNRSMSFHDHDFYLLLCYLLQQSPDGIEASKLASKAD